MLVVAPAKIEDSSRRTCRGCAPAPVGGPRRDATESGDSVLLGAGRTPPPPNSTLIVAVLTVEEPPRRLWARLGRALSAVDEDACSGDATPNRRERGARSVAAASAAAGRVAFGSLAVPASTAPGTSSSLSRCANAGSSWTRFTSCRRREVSESRSRRSLTRETKSRRVTSEMSLRPLRSWRTVGV